MKRLLLLPACLLAACNTPATQSAKATDSTSWTPPGPGTVVAADSMRYTEDPLNQFYFSVKLTVSSANATEPGDYGFTYDLATHCGPGEMNGTIQMPAGGRSLRPLLRRAPEGGYRYLIGFIAGKDLGGDGQTFQELYSVTGSDKKVEIRQLKTYRFR